MASRVKTRESANGEIIAYSETAIRNNISNVEYVKTSLSSLSGCTAGNLILIHLINALDVKLVSFSLQEFLD